MRLGVVFYGLSETYMGYLVEHLEPWREVQPVCYQNDSQIAETAEFGVWGGLLVVAGKQQPGNRFLDLAKLVNPLAFDILIVQDDDWEQSALKLVVQAGKMLKADLSHRVIDYPQAPVLLRASCRWSSGCRHCYLACPFGAIRGEATALTIIHENCKGCGACTSACPVGALQMPTATDAQFLAMIEGLNQSPIEQKSLLLTCSAGSVEKTPRGMVVGKIPCLGLLGISHLAIATTDIVGHLFTYCPYPDSCPHVSGLAGYLENMDFFSTFLPTGHTVVKHFAGPGSFQEVVKFHHEPVQVFSNQGPPFSGERRPDLCQAIKRLHHLPVALDSDRFSFYRAVVESACTLCGSCTRICPEGAIREIDRAFSKQILFNMAKCVGCGECVRNCPEEAIRLEKTFDLTPIIEEKLVLLLEDTVMKCRKCGKTLGFSYAFQKIASRLADGGISPDAVFFCEQCKQLAVQEKGVSHGVRTWF
ncbi:MAG: 4Fe-4S binding protein [Desulfitobacteriaceae bacterium]|nr:4Fe-4S binding protein [Desulfitobacteriaceae bacterium]MDI6913547.1 4Fe-4S binding protein [Desulfitobacteriaceae bacterium]